MTKEKAKDFLPLMQALADGKIIQYFDDSMNVWSDVDDVFFSESIEKYRIKPEEEYVPFDIVEELIDCWNQKKNNGKPTYDTKLNMPLIWVKRKFSDFSKNFITGFEEADVYLDDAYYTMKELFEDFTFLDGTPIGKIKE